jgi:hypothetical protein
LKFSGLGPVKRSVPELFGIEIAVQKWTGTDGHLFLWG